MIKAIKKFYVEHFIATMSLIITIGLILMLVGFNLTHDTWYSFLILKSGELILVASIVKIILSLNNFSSALLDTLKKFFVSKEYLDQLKPQELKNLIDYLNSSSRNFYTITNNNKLERSIDLARDKAIERNKDFFIRIGTASKVFFANNLEMSIYSYEIEMLKKTKFVFNYNFETNNTARAFPSFDQYLTNIDRFDDFTFKAIISNCRKAEGDNYLEEIVLDSIENTYEENEDPQYKKKLILSTGMTLNKGDTFTLDICLSNAEERINGAEHPSISFTSPAGLRIIQLQDEKYKNETSNISGGDLAIINNAGEEEIDLDNKQIINDMFYKKFKWEIYFEDIKDLEKPNIKLNIY